MIYAYPCQLTPDEDGGLVATFPDVPEAITGGSDRAKTLTMAEDALATALAGYVHEKRGIPAPSEAADGQVSVAVPTVVAAKLALDSAMRAQRITKVELADRLGVSESAVRKLTNPDHRSHMSQVQRALRAVSRSLKIEVNVAESIASKETSQPNIRLTNSQRAVFEYFADLDKEDRRSNSPKLVPIFLGALEVINGSNPDRFALASHNLRELIAFMRLALLDEVRALDKRMSDEVDALASRWIRASKSPSRDDKGRWSGEIDPSLKGFLHKAEDFFDWFRSNREKRRQETVEALQHLSASERRVPPPLATMNANYWQEMADYFVSVCHHNRTTDENEFWGYLDAFERFIAERVRPRTFERARELQALIDEVEKRA